jgi:ABC-type sugar transport system permease subunit
VRSRRDWVGQGIRREQRLGYLFVAPMLLFLLGIIFFPLAHAFTTSLYREAGVNVRFVGLGNYRRLLEDEAFWNSLRVSVVFTTASVALHLAVAMPLALFLNQLRRGRTTLRLLFLTPWMVTPVIGATAWVWLLEPHFGVVNYLLRSLGLISAYKIWLGEPALALGSVVAVDVWRGFPFVMLILLAGLQTVPREEYEAASIDGAGAFQRFLFITLPHLRYLLVVATTLDVINTIRTFDIVAVMTRGGPVNATEILPVLIFNTAFQANRFGPAAAVGVVLLLLLLVFSTVYILLLQPERAGERLR